jgi:superfamily II DNA/RNA helicase
MQSKEDEIPEYKSESKSDDEDNGGKEINVSHIQSSWEDFHLRPEILRAIREAGFSNPSAV